MTFYTAHFFYDVRVNFSSGCINNPQQKGNLYLCLQKQLRLENPHKKIYALGTNVYGSDIQGLNREEQTPEFKSVSFPIRKIVDKIQVSVNNILIIAEEQVYVCGKNYYGELGVGNRQPVETFQAITLGDEEKIIDFGKQNGLMNDCGHNLFLTYTHHVFACGSNQWGELGLNHYKESPISQELPFFADKKVIALSISSGRSMALTSTGEVYVWGSNVEGELGCGDIGYSTKSPIQVPLTNIVAISTGLRHMLALDQRGIIFSWGSNPLGQLGYNDPIALSPKKVFFKEVKFKAIEASDYTSVGLTKNGEVYIWGGLFRYDIYNKDRSLPVKVEKLPFIKSISVFNNVVSVLSELGEVYEITKYLEPAKKDDLQDIKIERIYGQIGKNDSKGLGFAFTY